MRWTTTALALTLAAASSGCLVVQNRYSLVDASASEVLAEAAGSPAALGVIAAVVVISAALGALVCWLAFRWRVGRRAVAEKAAASRALEEAGRAAASACDLSPPDATGVIGPGKREHVAAAGDRRS